MFGALKEKLKNWIKKTKEEDVSPDEIEEVIEKDSVKKEEKKKEKEKERKKNKIVEEKYTEEKKESKKSKDKISQEDKDIKNEQDEISQKEENFKEEITNIKKEENNEQTKEEKKESFFSRFHKKLTEEKFEELFEELELIMMQNNVAYEAICSIKDSLRGKLVGRNLKEVKLEEELKQSIKEILINPPNFIQDIKVSLKEKSPFVILFAGINGSGKTTTIAKIADYLQKNKFSVCLAAADTFRAAAIQQLEEHANKLNAPIIKKDYGADPAAVGFDAITYAKKNKIDIVLIDTAGRMQNRDSLMKEIEKVVRVTKPDMKIFLGESITGNDATLQAKTFDEAINLTGIILSKADVDEKGGTAISVSHVTGKPILFLGTGQEYKDIEVFDKEKLIEKLGL
jgi:fused signal recognition particle receptor